MKTRHAFCFSILCSAVATASLSADAQEGSFDPSWNGNGRRLVDFSSEEEVLSHLLVAPDNKVLLAGWCTDFSGAGYACVARLHSNGVLDVGFGPSGSGMVQLNELGGVQLSFTSGFARGSDGALWIAGRNTVVGSQAYVARLSEDGSTLMGALAFNFNNLPAQPNSFLQAMAAAPGNAFVVAGTMRRDNTTNRDIAVARLVTDESGAIALDPSFGSDGVARILIGREVTDIKVLDDGRILIAGLLAAGNSSAGLSAGYVMRLLANGTIDDPFGIAAGYTQLGLCTGAFSGYEPRIAIDAQGRIAVAYTANFRLPDGTSLDSEICVNRLLPDGRQDPSFGGTTTPGGTGRPVRVNIGGSQFLESITVGADGKIIVGGDNVGPGSRCASNCFMVARLNESPRSNTVLDLSFGLGGAGVSSYDGESDWDSATALAIGNGGLMIAGFSAHIFEPYVPARFGVAKVQLGSAAFDPIFADGFE